ncbi:hypothetical protein D9M68_903080 [compost metagenome]
MKSIVHSIMLFFFLQDEEDHKINTEKCRIFLKSFDGYESDISGYRLFKGGGKCRGIRSCGGACSGGTGGFISFV